MNRCKMYKNNYSGYKGIHWDKLRCKWYVRISTKEESYFLGRFKNFDDAVEIREQAETAISLLRDMDAVNIHSVSIKRSHKSIAGFVSKDGFDYKLELQINGTEPAYSVVVGDL